MVEFKISFKGYHLVLINIYHFHLNGNTLWYYPVSENALHTVINSTTITNCYEDVLYAKNVCFGG